MDKFIWIIGLSILSGVCYRAGGSARGNRLYRIIGCPLTALLSIWVLLGLTLAYWRAYLASFGLMAGGISAYWGLDEQKWGYWAHGLGISLAIFPIAYLTQHWLGFGLRCLVLTALITLWSHYTKLDILEEFGRGALIILTLPLLTI